MNNKKIDSDKLIRKNPRMGNYSTLGCFYPFFGKREKHATGGYQERQGEIGRQAMNELKEVKRW